MKKTLSILLVSLILLTSVAMLPASAAADKITYTEKEVKAYLYSMDDTITLNCLFRDDIPELPYIDVTDYLNQFYKADFTEKDNGDGTFTVSNKNGDFIVDAEKDIIHFDCFEQIAYKDTEQPVSNMESKFLDTDNNYEVVGETKAYDYSLGNYDIDITSKDGRVYLPLTSISDLFSCTYFVGQYLGGEIYFIKSMEEKKYFDDAKYYEQMAKRTEGLVNYTYSELCFVMDNLYGYPPKCKLASSVKEKGFDRTLEEYDENTKQLKSMLKTDDITDFWFGLLLLDGYFNDGGHTSLSLGAMEYLEAHSDSAFSQELQSRMQDPDNIATVAQLMQDALVGAQTREALKAQQKNDLAKYKVVKEWDKAVFVQDGDTGLFSFDSFVDEAVDQLKWSLDYAKENGIKNFVIDVTTNGGGSSAVVMYIMAVLTHQNQFTLNLTNAVTDNRLTSESMVDVNLDGKFDEKDIEVGYDFNFAILTTNCSFSSANMLPCVAQDNGIPIIGETSGGGTCMISKQTYPAFGNYAISNQLMMTHENGKDLDAGAAPNFSLVTPGVPEMGISADYKNLYDLKTISKDIVEFYKNPEAHKPATVDQSLPIANIVSSDNNSSSKTTLIIVLIAVLAVIVIVVVLIIVIRKRRVRAVLKEIEESKKAKNTDE